jgi:hypothetical protein
VTPKPEGSRKFVHVDLERREEMERRIAVEERDESKKV